MNLVIAQGLILPFLGTTLGACGVLVMKNNLHGGLRRILSAFAGGVMAAASIWSLLIPGMELSAHMGRGAFVPSLLGFWLGTLFMLLMDKLVPHYHAESSFEEGMAVDMDKNIKLFLAVTLHNIPEGMALGIVFAGWVAGTESITLGGAFALALGLAIQNFPEGAIVSMPLRAGGLSKKSAMGLGILSGIVEPIFALLTILAARFILPLLPYFLSFAAAVMIYVVVENLIPEAAEGGHWNAPTLSFAAGFSLMMVLDVALG
ncbi:MAG: ZIP family metal transporter [Tissierellia bacterium]|nr:ZIP family metal transporter [Tissierellia bacterium]